MGRNGCLVRVVIAGVALLALLVVGRIFFPLSGMPHLELAAEELFSLGGFPITNTMLTAWITIVVVCAVAFAATRHMSIVPRGLQNIVESLMETLINFVDDTAGKEYGRRFFPIIATIFIFVMFNAWLALIPGYMFITYGPEQVPLLRGANTDINFPLALALISFVFVEFWGIRSHGVLRYLGRFIILGGVLRGLGQMVRGKLKSGLGQLFMGFIEAFAGFMELISEFVRILSLTFRLFGNMTAGEILILTMIFLVPWVAAIPFYGLELFIGFVQAFIFAGLTLVFLVIAVTPREEHQ